MTLLTRVLHLHPFPSSFVSFHCAPRMAGHSFTRHLHFSRSPDPSVTPRHVLTLTDLSVADIVHILQRAAHMKDDPNFYSDTLRNHTLLMLFEKPSLRTRLSFETGMTQLGGHAIYYPLDSGAPLGKKEAISDTAIVASRYADLIMARVKSRTMLREFAQYATVPVINALDDYAHPCQILADLQTIFTVKQRNWERSRDTHHACKQQIDSKRSVSTADDYSLSNVRIAYVGDISNNVTYDIMRAAALFGADLCLAGPIHISDKYKPETDVIHQCESINASSHGRLLITHLAKDAVQNADVVITDTWQSYHLDAQEAARRIELFKPYRVTSQLMSLAAKHALFMHCLPAQRGMEVEADVMDGEQSVIYDEAENRLHAQKALMSFLLNKPKPA